MKKLLIAALLMFSLTVALDNKMVTERVSGTSMGTQTITIPVIADQKFFVTAVIFDGDATTSNLVISDGTTITTTNVGATLGQWIAGGQPVIVGLTGAAMTFKINGNSNFSAIVTGKYLR